MNDAIAKISTELLTNDGLTRIERRDKILWIEEAIKAHPDALGEDPFPLEHIFTPGLYTRQMVAPKGALMVGKLHKTEHVAFMLRGDVSVLTEDGVNRIVGPCMLVSPVGVKRIGFVHEEMVWVNVFPNPENITDLAELEKMTIAADYNELSAGGHVCLD